MSMCYDAVDAAVNRFEIRIMAMRLCVTDSITETGGTGVLQLDVFHRKFERVLA
jgi:hypothetical protein